MSPLGWHPPHLVDNTDTQCLGSQHWQQCWCFRFFFFFVLICLCMYQSVRVSVYLLTVTLKFLKTHNYWLAQLLNLSPVPGLEFKKCRLLIKMLRNSSKNHGKVLVTGFGRKQSLQQLKLLLLSWLLFVLLYTSCQQWSL